MPEEIGFDGSVTYCCSVEWIPSAPSTTWTSTPARTRALAAASPPIPPPTIATRIQVIGAFFLYRRQLGVVPRLARRSYDRPHTGGLPPCYSICPWSSYVTIARRATS